MFLELKIDKLIFSIILFFIAGILNPINAQTIQNNPSLDNQSVVVADSIYIFHSFIEIPDSLNHILDNFLKTD